MVFDFNSFSINKVDKSKLTFNMNSFALNPIPVTPPTPIELLQLKDSNGNYLYDSNNDKLFVRR